MTPISEVENPGEIRHGLGPIWAAARVANPDFETCGVVTFQSGPIFSLSAPAWREAIFVPAIFPALRNALEQARLGRVRELAGIDAGLSRKLPPAAAAASLRAGRRLAAIGGELRGERLIKRWTDQVAADPVCGHLAVGFAARCAAFSLPDRVAVGAYLFQELCAGAPGARVDEVCAFVADCLEPLGKMTGQRAA